MTKHRIEFNIAALVLVVMALMLLTPPTLDAQPSFDAGRVTVAVTATPIYVTPQRGGGVRICNRHTTPIFVGSSTVTIANGFEILNATCENFRAYPKATIYGIVAAATARIDYAAGDYREP